MKVTNAVVSVLAERERQKAKGFTEGRDDMYEAGMLNAAGAVYLDYAYDFQHRPYDPEKDTHIDLRWPFMGKPDLADHPREILVKGVALGLAEIERIDRSEGITQPVPADFHQGVQLQAIAQYLGLPEGISVLDYIKAVEECRAVPVQRNDLGLWTHPAYIKAFGGCDSVPAGMFNAWLQHLDLESKTVVFSPNDIGEISWEDVAEWEPEAPEGQGWFIGSIHESEDYGVVCVWLRKTK